MTDVSREVSEILFLKTENTSEEEESGEGLTLEWSSRSGKAAWPSDSWLAWPGPWARVWGCRPSRRCPRPPWP